MELSTSKYRFHILMDGLVCAEFAEVSGMDQPSEPLEFRGGANRVGITGLLKCEPIALKHGSSDNKEFIDWIVSCKTNMAVCKNISIMLSDGGDLPAAVWEIISVSPLKYTAEQLKADAKEALFERIELKHEGIKRTK